MRDYVNEFRVDIWCFAELIPGKKNYVLNRYLHDKLCEKF